MSLEQLKPLNLIWVMPAEETMTAPAALPPPQLGSYAKKQLKNLNEWLAFDHQTPLAPLQKEAIQTTLTDELVRTEAAVVSSVKQAVGSSKAQQLEAGILQRVRTLVFGKTKPSGLLFHLAAWSQLPAALLTPVTEAWVMRHATLPDEVKRAQVEKEISRQTIGIGLNFIQVYASLGFKQGMKLLHRRGVPGLGKLFANEASETATSLLVLMAFNGLGFGVIRPLATNGLFLNVFNNRNAFPRLRHWLGEHSLVSAQASKNQKASQNEVIPKPLTTAGLPNSFSFVTPETTTRGEGPPPTVEMRRDPLLSGAFLGNRLALPVTQHRPFFSPALIVSARRNGLPADGTAVVTAL